MLMYQWFLGGINIFIADCNFYYLFVGLVAFLRLEIL